jgi:NAD(P)-dependent dehydrogenase (short-subunit alcohol dehydrogenase family)
MLGLSVAANRKAAPRSFDMPSERVVLVTGGNRGIGLEICRQLAKRGARVILGARELKKAEQAAREVDAAYSGTSRVSGYAIDVTNDDMIAAAVKRVEKEHGRLDILINNAGIFDKQDGSVLEAKVAVIERTFATNVYGPLKMCQQFMPLIKRGSDARIVNVSSGMGALAEIGPGYAAYRLSKTALNGLTGILAAELTEAKIMVTAMCPGWVKTDMGGPNAPRSVEQGADTAVWLALDSDHGVHGKFVRDRAVIPW